MTDDMNQDIESIDNNQPVKAESIFKNRDYRLLFFGQMVSNLGTHIYNFAISLYILVLTDGNATLAGIYMATGGMIYFGFALFGGAIVDRLEKVRVVYTTDFINGILILITGSLLFFGLSNTTIIVILFVVTIIMGVNGALFNPAASSLPPHILQENQLQQHSSISQGMFAIYGIIGAMLGGVLYSFVPIGVIFIFNGLTFFFSGVSETFIKTKTLEEGEVHDITFKQTLVDIKEGLQYVFTLKPILWLVIIASMLNFFTVPVVVNGLPYLFEIEIEKEAYFLAILNSSFTIGIVIVSVVLAVSIQRERVSPLIYRGLVGMASMFLFTAAALHFLLDGTLSFTWYMVISAISLIVMGFFNGFINIPFNVAIMKTIKKQMLGRVVTTIGIISNGLTPIAIALGGVAIDFLGLRVLFYVAAIAMWATAILALRNKYVREL
ncbi:MFS transporter [Candidatus Xianfuyuplasma coldseepsis]|uniref:MFS transporter n=1 Tax=Candidatus Xianfuyuplasma coldseepsis TaxID=2782163 RepID=A0A7L7KPU2_9MOLU|nr:MFS transporter [Xianfuyuplasma coldseepsis]QMS84272.1 MFS transporter [Xianfuyuplasma coldseepsis]